MQLKRRGETFKTPWTKIEERSNCVESRMEDSGLVQANEQLEMAQKTLHQDGDGSSPRMEF